MRICALCSNEKPDREYRPRGRGLSKVCHACEDGVATEAAAIADELPTPVTLTGSLEVTAGYGFRASIEDGRLVLEQDAQTEDGEARTESITLAPHEVRRLFEWAEQVLEREQAA